MLPKDVKGICEMLDATVHISEGNVYCIVDKGDSSVGLYPVFYTPYFRYKEEMILYCASDEGRREISAIAADVFPDWDYAKQEWTD